MQRHAEVEEPAVDQTPESRITAVAPPASSRAEAGADFRLLNRELSWLDFDARVMALAEDAAQPLLERTKFLAIFSRNLDDFFQVRVSGLKEQLAAGLGKPSPEGTSLREQLEAIRTVVLVLMERQTRAFREIAAGLADVGIRFSDWDDLDQDDRRHLSAVFEERIFPVLTPLAVDPAHPFPYISNLSLNLAVSVDDPEGGPSRVARVKVPGVLPRFVVMPDGERLVPLEQVIAVHLGRLFPGMTVRAYHPFRLTRDADFELDDDDADDLLEAVQSVLRRRRRSPLAVRLEVHSSMPEQVLDLLAGELGLVAADVYVSDCPLDLGGLWDLHKLDRPDLKDRPQPPVTRPYIAGLRHDEPSDLFAAMQHGPLLVQHPYESFEGSVEAFIDQAAADPDVLAIKQSLYRTSTAGRIITSLARAAESGKQVVALVELTARGDEQANINWAQVLEKAGVHVVYGMVGLKTHAKVTLAVRLEQGGIRRYCHLGTGNYNSDTARTYEDLGLFTADAKIGADLSDLFNALTGYSRQRSYRRLLVAPMTLRGALLERIHGQAHPGGRIDIKVNSLTDPECIEALYAASSSGAEIDLLVRGMCCLRPGVPGLSERIRVRSLVGRNLEHSRIYCFGRPAPDAEYWIGSADLMPRNLDRRVEVLAPITAPSLRSRIDEIIDVELADDVLAWTLGPDGTWTKVATVSGTNAHLRLQESAVARAHEGG